MLSRSMLYACSMVVLTIVILFQGAAAQSPDGPLPDGPQNLNISYSEGIVTLSWNPPAYSGDSTVTSYYIYRGESPGLENYLSETYSTNFEDTSIEQERTYYYQVSARNDAGEGEKSYEVSISTAPHSSTVSGRCTESGSMDGIEDVHIRFEEQQPPYRSFETWTDNSGSYSIELQEGEYRVRLEADGYRSDEDYFNVEGPMNRYFTLESDEEEGFEFNLTEILGIDEDEIKDFALTVVIIVISFLMIIPISFIIVLIFLLIMFIRLGKIRKEIRAKNESEGIFLSKRRLRKHMKKTQSEITSSDERKEKSSTTIKKEEASSSSKKKHTLTVEEVSEENEQD